MDLVCIKEYKLDSQRHRPIFQSLMVSQVSSLQIPKRLSC